MRITKRIVNESHIENLFRNLARQKTVPVSVRYQGRVFDASLFFTEKRGIRPELLFNEGAPNLAAGSSIEVNFINKGVLFFFQTPVTAVTGDVCRIELPLTVFSKFRRLFSRTVLREKEGEDAAIFHNGIRYRLVDISVGGIAFVGDDTSFEMGSRLSDVRFDITGMEDIYGDLLIRYSRKNRQGQSVYGAEFLDIDLFTHSRIFSLVFSRSYPEIRHLNSVEPNALLALLEPTVSEGPQEPAEELLTRLLKQTMTPTLGTGYGYMKQDKLMSCGALVRLYERTFLGQHLISDSQARLEPKAGVRLHIALADFMLNHPYMEYYTNYIRTDLDWHREIFSDMDRIIGDPETFHFSICQHFEAELAALNDESTGEYLVEALEIPDEFIEFIQSNVSGLEFESSAYGSAGFDLDAIAQIYAAAGSYIDRRLWRVTRNGVVHAYTVAESYPDELELVNLANTCKVFPSSFGADIQGILEAVVHRASTFYKKNRKARFHVLIKSWTPIARSVAIPGLQYISEIGKLIMDRRGLVMYKKLLLDNFVQYKKYYPLTHPQLSIWQTEKFHTGTCFGNICSSTRIQGSVDLELLETAIRRALEKNDGLRLRLEVIGAKPRQYVSPYEFQRIERFAFSHLGGEAAFGVWLEDQNSRPFHLIDAPLYYFAIYQVNSKEGGFYVRTHHLISDGWAVVWLSGKIMEYYSALCRGGTVSKRRKASYLEYVSSEQAFLASETAQKQKNYWKEKFATIPEFTGLKPHAAKVGGTASNRISREVSPEISAAINGLCESEKVSPFLVFLGVLYIYLQRVTGKSDIVVGTPVLNRSNAREKEMFGMFVSMVPMRMSVEASATAQQFLALISREWKAVLKHQKYPYDQIIREYRETHGTKDLLFDIILSYQNATATADDAVEAHQIHWHHNGHQTETLAIHINDRNNTGVYEIAFDYLPEAFSEAEINALWGHYARLLSELVFHPEKQILRMEMLSEEESRRIRYEFNATTVPYPQDVTIHRLFEMQTQRTPHSIAAVQGKLKLTYKELNDQADRLAAALSRLGMEPGASAAILMEPSLEMLTAILAVLKNGGAYVPVDPEYPEERIRHMLDDSGSRFLLVDVGTGKALAGIQVVEVAGLLEAQEAPERITSRGNSRDAAYIIYTSGSTGKPKGVLVEHRSLVNLCCWHNRQFGITESDQATKYAGVGFDASVWEIFPYLIAGATLHIIEKRIRYDIVKLNAYYRTHGITISFLPTQICERFMELGNDSLRYLLTGADKLNRFIPGAYQLVNNYGPTESTVVTTSFVVDRSYGNIPIGKPIDNTRLYILDAHGALQPVGVPGELHIAGDGLARAYNGSPELTAEKFISGAAVGEERLYRTGDLARWLPDGNVEFLGRIDNQVKIRGYRIEIGEIEGCLLAVPEIRQAVVEVREGGNGQKHLCAFCVSDQPFDPARIRSILAAQLPDYMVPPQLIRLDSIPLTANGKIDRARLPEVGLEERPEEMPLEPETPVEKAVIQAAQQILGSRVIGVNHNLVNIGFDSLMLIQLIAELSSIGLEIAMQDFYECPTVQALALRLEGGGPTAVEPPAAAIPQPVLAEPVSECILDGAEKLDHVLLTGATGYLGAHLLKDLLLLTDAEVTCLIRASDLGHAKSRLLQRMRQYFPELPHTLLDQRVHALAGDISEPDLGLDKASLHELGSGLDAVFNPAANVRHFGSYEDFERNNIGGVVNLIDFCRQYDLRLNQISTVSVSGNYALQKQAGLVFSENDLAIGQDVSDNPYVKSKLEAEKRLAQAVEQGVPCTVFRVGNLTGRYQDGVFQANIGDNRFYNMLRTILITGTVPESLMGQVTDLTPVDACSRAAVMLAIRQKTRNRRYHLYNSQTLSIRQIIASLPDQDSEIRVLKDQEFMEHLNRTSRETGDYELLKGFIGLSKTREDQGIKHPVTIRSDETAQQLNALGFSWPPVDSAYIERLIRHISEIGFITST